MNTDRKREEGEGNEGEGRGRRKDEGRKKGMGRQGGRKGKFNLGFEERIERGKLAVYARYSVVPLSRTFSVINMNPRSVYPYPLYK